MSALKFKLYSNQAHNSNLQEVLPAVFVLKTEATQCKLKNKQTKKTSIFWAQCWMSCEGSLSHFKQILKRVTLHKQEGITTRFCCWLHDVTKLCPQYDFWEYKLPPQTITDHHLCLFIFISDFSEAKGSDVPAGRLAGPSASSSRRRLVLLLFALGFE